MTAPPRLLGLLLAAVWLGACATDRLRPGPPSLVLEPPTGNTVFSPDTLLLYIRAQDDNGLDSVTITILGETESLDAFERVDYEDIVFWPIPEGLVPGQLVEIVGYAKDLVGDRTTARASVTVVARPAAAGARSVDPPPERG